MRYGSVCSGIEAASVAWAPLGWEAEFFSEIDRFPCEVLAHHYGSNLPGETLARNGVPNFGDMTKFKEWPDAAIDVLVGGTPCQSFSVAGLRAGLADPRGNLALTYLAVAAKYQPRWILWENVPGVLSSVSHDAPDPCPPADPVDMECEGAEVVTDDEYDATESDALGCFLAGLAELGYGWAYRTLDAQHVRVDGFERAVPQRRRRVFVVGYLGYWRRAAAVLFDAASLRGDPAPRREAGQGTSADVVSSLTASGRGVERTGETRGQDPVIAVADVASTLNAHYGDKQGLENQHINQGGPLFVAFDTTQITSKANVSNPKPGDPCHPLAAGAHAPAIAFQGRGSNLDTNGEISGTLGTNADCASGGAPMVAWSIMPQNSGKDYKAREVDVAQPLMAGGPVGGNQGGDYIQQAVALQSTNTPREKAQNGIGVSDEGVMYSLTGRDQHGIALGWAVRRLTPTECERLQGFPEISKSVRIQVCEDANTDSARFAARASQAQNRGASAPALVHVQINLERQAVEIHRAGRLLWSASTAAAPSSSPLSMPLDAFVRLAALMTATAVPQTPHGAVASPASTSSSFPRLSGSASVNSSGREIDALVSDAGKFTETVTGCMRFTTSPSGHSSQISAPTLETLSCCVVAAISSCIPSEIRQANSYSVTVETVTGYTAVPHRNKPAADGPRYKALGNSMAVNVMRWIGQRIAIVDAMAEAEREDAA